MAHAKSMSAEDKRWEAENDARTLATANEIVADKPRMNAAKKEAMRLAIETQKSAAAMRKVSNTKPAKKTSRKKR